MVQYPPSMDNLIKALAKLPSVGRKSAARLAYHMLTDGKENALNIANAIKLASERVRYCRECHYLSETELCEICSNLSRDMSKICIVEKPADVIAIERMNEYRGIYHVLHGLWAPLKGIGIENIRLDNLSERILKRNVTEVIIALSATVEGEATSMYIARSLAEHNGLKVSKLAQGMPRGGELEYTDEATLQRAFEGRSILNA